MSKKKKKPNRLPYLLLFLFFGGYVLAKMMLPPVSNPAPPQKSTIISADSQPKFSPEVRKVSYNQGFDDGFIVGHAAAREGKERDGLWAMNAGKVHSKDHSGDPKEYAKGYHQGYNEGWHEAVKAGAVIRK